jgi:hypothetical protein
MSATAQSRRTKINCRVDLTGGVTVCKASWNLVAVSDLASPQKLQENLTSQKFRKFQFLINDAKEKGGCETGKVPVQVGLADAREKCLT